MQMTNLGLAGKQGSSSHAYRMCGKGFGREWLLLTCGSKDVRGVSRRLWWPSKAKYLGQEEKRMSGGELSDGKGMKSEVSEG